MASQWESILSVARSSNSHFLNQTAGQIVIISTAAGLHAWRGSPDSLVSWRPGRRERQEGKKRVQQDEGAATPSPGSACNQAAVARRFNQCFGESCTGSHQQGLHHRRIVTHINCTYSHIADTSHYTIHSGALFGPSVPPWNLELAQVETQIHCKEVFTLAWGDISTDSKKTKLRYKHFSHLQVMWRKRRPTWHGAEWVDRREYYKSYINWVEYLDLQVELREKGLPKAVANIMLEIIGKLSSRGI